MRKSGLYSTSLMNSPYFTTSTANDACRPHLLQIPWSIWRGIWTEKWFWKWRWRHYHAVKQEWTTMTIYYRLMGVCDSYCTVLVLNPREGKLLLRELQDDNAEMQSCKLSVIISTRNMGVASQNIKSFFTRNRCKIFLFLFSYRKIYLRNSALKMLTRIPPLWERSSHGTTDTILYGCHIRSLHYR